MAPREQDDGLIRIFLKLSGNEGDVVVAGERERKKRWCRNAIVLPPSRYVVLGTLLRLPTEIAKFTF